MSPPGAAAGPNSRKRRRSDTAVVAVSIEGIGSEMVTVTPAMAQRWYTAQPRGERKGPVMGLDIEDCAAQAAVTALPVENLTEARDDPRWDVTRGFLDAWLAQQSTERWTAVAFDAPSLSVVYDSWKFTGVGGPAAVPGTGIEVVPVDFEATADGATRSYRAFVAVVADPTGRWTVNAVGHRHPS